LFKKQWAQIQDPSGKDTPFTAAFYWKRFRVAEWFLQKGSDVNAQDDGGNTSLHLVIRKKYDLEAVRLLLRYRADVNIKNNEGISLKAMAETNRQRKFLALFKSS
jgi:ankyrin repeat protein